MRRGGPSCHGGPLVECTPCTGAHILRSFGLQVTRAGKYSKLPAPRCASLRTTVGSVRLPLFDPNDFLSPFKVQKPEHRVCCVAASF